MSKWIEWDREDILFSSVPLGEGQCWQLLAHISSNESVQEVQRGQAGHDSSTLKWTSCRLCPKISHLAFKGLSFLFSFFTVREQLFIHSYQRPKMCLVLLGALESGGKCPTASSLHPSLQCVIGNCVHVYKRSAFWKGIGKG